MNRPPIDPQHRQLESTVARLVAEALRSGRFRLGNEATGKLPAIGDSVAPQHLASGANSATGANSSEAMLIERVISVAGLQQLSGSFDTLRVNRRAVVTPAALDWLKQKKIRVVRGIAADDSAKRATGTKVSAESREQPAIGCAMVVDMVSPQRAAGVTRQLGLRGLDVVEGTIDQLVAEHVQASKLNSAPGILLSDLPAVDVDLLARQHSLSVAAVDSVGQVRLIVARMQPRVWVLDASRLHLSGMVAVAETCLRQRRGG
jgi:hypothetical protein